MRNDLLCFTVWESTVHGVRKTSELTVAGACLCGYTPLKDRQVANKQGSVTALHSAHPLQHFLQPGLIP